MGLYLENPADVHMFFVEEIAPRADNFVISESSRDHMLRANGVGMVGFSGVGKEYHDKEFIGFAASLGQRVILAEQETTRLPRTKAEANGKSAYTHRDLREPEVRQSIIRDLDERKYVQTHIWKSREFNEDPDDLSEPAQPTHLYMTRAEAFSLEPDTVTLVEYVLSQTEAFVRDGLLRKGMVMFATTQPRWTNRYYAREGKWPDNHSSRMEHAIDSTVSTRCLVEEEDAQDLSPEERKWLLLLNDYLDGKGGLDPAFIQMYHNLYGQPDMDVHQDAYAESEQALDWIRQMQALDEEIHYSSALITVDDTDVIQRINASRVNA